MALPNVLIEIAKMVNPIHIPKLTGLRPSAVAAHFKGIVKPSAGSIKKYVNAYRRVNYTRLRAAGANWKTANSLKGGSLLTVNDVVNRNNTFADFIVSSREFEVDKQVILEAMSKSKKNINDFERDSM